MKAQPNAKRKLSVGKKISLICLALVLALATVAIVAYSRYLYPTGKILTGLYAIRTHNNGMPMGNFFLMRVGDKYIAIDAGADNAETERQLLKLGISTSDITAVFITHSHWDHIGAIGLFDNATVYAGNTENNGFPEIPHQIMLDGEIIEISAMSVQCIYTPGHTSDSVCYLIDGKYMFAGDLFVTTNEPPSPNPRRYNVELQLHHRKNVLRMDGVECVFTGHFGLFKDIRLFRRWY